MGYERNDRRFGSSNDRFGYGGQGSERGRYGSFDEGRGRDDDRARSYGADTGYGRRDGRERAEWRERDDHDRGFFDRAGDEVRSWFGDEDAERRRRRDELEAERDYRRNYGSSRESYSPDRGYERGFDTGPRDANRGLHHDQGYNSWRDRQMSAFDRDYDEYRRENQGRFEAEFGQWRQQRQGQRDQLGKVQEHQEVIGSDGSHIGTVDHVRGDRILLTKADQAAGGHHHSIPLSWIQSVDDKITLSKTADEAKNHWRDEERGAFGWGGDHDHGRTNLNRSFSGTY
jgi:hypothetical protein